MINLNFTNYKAFIEGELEFAPLTVLLGANSSGKSSLLQLLLLLQQSYGIKDRYDSPLKLNGRFVKLGEDENIVWNKSRSKILEIGVTFYVGTIRTRLRGTHRRLVEELGNIFIRLRDIYELINPDGLGNQRISKKILFPSANLRSEKDLARKGDEYLRLIPSLLRKIRREMKDPAKYQLINEIEPEIISRITRRRKGTISSIDDLINFNTKYYTSAIEFIKQFIEHDSRRINLTYKFRLDKETEKIVLNGISLVSEYGDTVFFKWDRIKAKRGYKNQIESAFIGERLLSEVRNKVAGKLKFYGLSSIARDRGLAPNMFAYEEIDEEPVNALIFMLIHFVNFCVDQASKYFEEGQLNYIGPLRAFPERYYFLDESKRHSYVDSTDGNSLAELLKRDKNATLRVNKWLERFGLKVNVEDFKDIIHKIKIAQNGLRLDITDVGFGISQLLPIIVQGVVSKRGSINLIEQPEIHLHPKLQADLADLFIDLLYSDVENVNLKESLENIGLERTFLIETHSEYFLRRLRRRMAEGIKIIPEFVNIYFVDGRTSSQEGAVLKKIEIGKHGAFDWPLDYYVDDVEDTIAFLKHQQ